MDISNRQVWQVAAGDANRDYAALCLKWDVILIGPGSEKRWPDCVDILKEKWGLSAKKITDLQRFCEVVNDGDIVVLRVGTTDIYGVGIVVGDYIWCSEFGDVDGWDLEHVRRVRWLWPAEKRVPEPARFNTYTMKWGDTVQLLDSEEVRNWISQIELTDAAINRELKALPPSSDDPSDDEVQIEETSEYLFDKGVASDSIQSLVNQVGELTRIAKWYQKEQEHVPSESETLAYLVVPLLRALGWTPQRMAVEWHKVDVALFSALPRSDANLSVVVEVKQMNAACLSAKSQAQYYAMLEGRESCKRLIVTDGLRYGVFERNNGKFPDEPQAYLNLLRLRREYPVYDCFGANEAVLRMSPDWQPKDGG